MRRFLVLLASVLAAAMFAQPALADVGDFATGSGTSFQSGPPTSFNFNATGGPDPMGAFATGNMFYSQQFPPATVTAVVRCLFVVGNRATIVGRITSVTGSPPSGAFPGSNMTFYVQDNGTPGAGIDRWLPQFGIASEFACPQFVLGPPIAQGEIVVVEAPDQPATIALSPTTDENPVGTQHCVTATVRDAAGRPTPNVLVRFQVTGSVNTAGQATTNANGQATFCYTGPSLPGADVITAYADTDRDNMRDPTEPNAVAEKTWVLPASTPGCEAIITNGGWIVAANGDRASFGGNAHVEADGAVKGQEQYTDHGPAQPIKVHSINVLAVVCDNARTQADIYGEATIDGQGRFDYRIQVRDLAEPGKGTDTYWILLSNGYSSGDKTLEGGNVQIHDRT
jgi:Bacterial Ig-like domain (group 1)